MNKEQCVAEFIEAVRAVARYWKNETRGSAEDRIDGCAFSILCLLDGVQGGYPPFNIAASHDGDSAWPSGLVFNDDVMLHELFYEKK